LKLVPALERLSQNLFISPPVLSQKAALAAFTPQTRQVVDGYREAYAAHAAYLVPALEAIGLRVPATPQGAFYVYCDISAHGRDSAQLCETVCDELGVLMAPGRDFTVQAPEQMIRVSFPKPIPTLREGVSRLEDYFFGRKA
jgi:aspartate/methionine/tyrosine aminotransferase